MEISKQKRVKYR